MCDVMCMLHMHSLMQAHPTMSYILLVYIRTGTHVQVIKNIKNVAGCRDTRTAKSKETRGMIEHNSEVYNPPYRDLLPYTGIMKNDM